MSGYRIHTLAYLALSIAFTFFFRDYLFRERPQEMIFISTGIGAIYSILPDIDMPSSFIRRIVEKASLAAIIVSIIVFLILQIALFLYVAIVLSVSLLLLWYFKHRTFFHSIAAGALLSAPLFFINPLYAGYAFLGFMTHLAVDGKLFHMF